MLLNASSIGRIAMASGGAAAVAAATLLAASCSLTTSLDGLTNGGSDAAVTPLDGPTSPLDGAGGSDADAFVPPDASTPDGGSVTATAYRAAVLADSPAGYWRLDETNITVSAKDLSGHGRDGTYSAGVSFGVAGAIAGDTAARFDGVMSLVDLGPIFRFDGTVSYTLEAWVRPEASATYGTVLGRNADPDGYSLYVSPVPGEGALRQAVDASASVAGAVLDAVSFSHVVVTFDGAKLRLYANGALAGSTATSVATKGTAKSFYIGADGDGTFFKGTIDEPAVYDHALTPERIFAHYMIGKGP